MGAGGYCLPLSGAGEILRTGGHGCPETIRTGAGDEENIKALDEHLRAMNVKADIQGRETPIQCLPEDGEPEQGLLGDL